MEDVPELILEEDIAAVAAPSMPLVGDLRILPFSFAKRHGVLIQSDAGSELQAAYRAGASPLSIAEARRFAGKKLKLTRVTAKVFDTLLQQTYEQGSHKAMQMVGDLDDHTDLLQVADMRICQLQRCSWSRLPARSTTRICKVAVSPADSASMIVSVALDG